MAHPAARSRQKPRSATLGLAAVLGLLALGGCAHRIPSGPIGSPDLLVDGARHPAPSPDGRRLAVQGLMAGRPFRSELFVFEGGEPLRLTRNAAFDGHPSWSPDGSLLAFTSGPQDAPMVKLLEMETLEERTLISRRALQPSFSPEGLQIAFIRLMATGTSVAEVRLADGAVRELVPPDGMHNAPVYHPDGRLVLYVRGKGASTDIWAVDRETRQRIPILATEHREQYPAISPDGQWLAVTSDRPLPDGRQGEGNSLWLVDISGKEPLWARPVALPDEGMSFAESRFTPDGRELRAARMAPGGSWEVIRVRLDSRGPSPEEPEEPADLMEEPSEDW